MRQIFAMLRLDTHLIFRDKIIWYVLFFPAIMAIILIAVSGRLSDNTPTFAVSADMPQDIIRDLEKVANLDFKPDRDSLYQRINAFDNVVGIFWENGKVQVVYQGNEGEEYFRRTAAFIDAALNKNIPKVKLVNTNTENDFIVQVVMAALLLSPALIGGTVSGFLIVADKEHKLIRGYQIAPIRFASYIGARSLLASIIGFISMIVLCLILGISSKIAALVLILLCSLPIFGVITVLFSSIAKDKVSCIAMFKILVMIFLVIPLASAFVPERLHSLFYPLPMYWQFQSVLNILNDSFHYQYGMVTFISSTLMLLFVTFTFRRKIHKI
ncbi:ABC transporter permease [Pseudoclostridium thermosuccinogenes]|uniref:ABC transporter permease n=1 Tax=Clostridium thermosuccinogenes TaxID=84032 RepID=UPI002FDAE2FA